MDGAPVTILLVDDRESNLLALSAVLEALPVRLVKATSGRDALKFLLTDDCSLILLDVQMPDLDGFETAALIHARERTRYVPIIFVTAVHREEQHIIKGYTHGAVDYMVKPFDPTALVAKVRVFVEQYTREQGLRQEAALRLRQADDARRREEAANADLEAQRQHLHALFMHAPAAIAIVRGPELVFELANPRFEEMVGFSSLRGQSGPAVLSGPSAMETWRVIQKVIADGEPFLGTQYPDLFGLAARYFNFVVQPTRDGDRNGNGAMIHAVDITDSVLAQRKTEALARRLQDIDRGKDQFLAMLGHELRNPLAPILTALQVMRMRATTSDASEKERAIIERQVNHLARLVDDLLDVSRATMGKIDLRREPLEVSVAVARAVEVTAPLVEAKKHRLTVKVPGAGLLVAGDPVRLSQVIANLLNNAAKYTDDGGEIDVEAHREDDIVCISVKDNGRGIVPQRLSAMFELFVQGDQPVDRSQGGIGVGLTLVRSLVQLHGGEVEARSEGPGKGSVFTVRLPLLFEPQVVRPPSDAKEGSPIAARRILVVDDNVDAAEMLGAALSHAGHDVREAYDGLAALVEAVRFRPQVMILDLGLPGVDGFEVARRVRADPRLAGTRIVALTGYGQDSDRRRTAEVGIDVHLVKPVPFEALLEAVTAA
ncbi:MAG TPA: response regulator [Myxococcales bacterium]|jgi:signal transduction histidine kinase